MDTRISTVITLNEPEMTLAALIANDQLNNRVISHPYLDETSTRDAVKDSVVACLAAVKGIDENPWTVFQKGFITPGHPLTRVHFHLHPLKGYSTIYDGLLEGNDYIVFAHVMGSSVELIGAATPRFIRRFTVEKQCLGNFHSSLTKKLAKFYGVRHSLLSDYKVIKTLFEKGNP